MNVMKYISGEWINGYGNGVTGPKTPSCAGPTVLEFLEHRQWSTCDPRAKYPEVRHTVVSCGMETVAIIPGNKEEREALALLISKSPRMLKVLAKLAEDWKNHRIKAYIGAGETGTLDTMQEVLDIVESLTE